MSVKKLANPNQNDANLLKLHVSEMGCCDGENLSTKKYDVVVDFSNAFTSVTIKVDGVNTEIPLNLPANSTKKQLRVAIAEALKTKGFDPFYGSDNYRGISVEGTTLSIIGEAELVNLKNTATKAFTVLGTKSRIVQTRFTFIEAEAPGSLFLEGEPAGTVIDASGNGYESGDEANLVSDFETAMTAQNMTYNKVVPTYLPATGNWVVDLYTIHESEKLTLDGVEGNTVDIFPGFIA